MEEKAMLIDTSKCTACRGCMVACKQWNQLSAVQTKNTGSYENPPTLTPNTFCKVVFREEVIDGKVRWLFRKEQCMHCTTAACVSICPVDARSKDEYGFTEIDKNKCIGCGACAAVCPYGVPQLDSTDRKIKNCWFCLDRVLAGMKPACAKTCPAGAIKYGTRADMLKVGKDAALKSGGKYKLYGENEYNGLHMLYVLEAAPEKYGLPAVVAALPDKFEMYALLEKNLAGSPQKTEVLTMAALKYFGNVHV